MEPESFIQRWESMIDARALMPAETGPAATNAYNTAMALATTEAAGNLPAIVAGEVGLSGFPRLKKLAATGAITTARLRGLAVRVGLGFPDDTDFSETASVDWAWSLAMLSRGITLKAIGWLQKAHAASPAEWDAAVLALGADGRFAVDYMTQQRKLMRDAQLARQQLLRNGGGFDAALTAGQAWAHVAANIADDDVMACTLAKSIANATSRRSDGTLPGQRRRARAATDSVGGSTDTFVSGGGHRLAQEDAMHR